MRPVSVAGTGMCARVRVLVFRVSASHALLYYAEFRIRMSERLNSRCADSSRDNSGLLAACVN